VASAAAARRREPTKPQDQLGSLAAWEEQGARQQGGGGFAAFASTSRLAFADPGKPQPRVRPPPRNVSQLPLHPGEARLFVTTAGETFRRHDTNAGAGGGTSGFVPGLASNPRRFNSSATGSGVVMSP
jgi:hypothetical protein